MSVDASWQNYYQQIGFQNHLCLYLYDIDAVLKEE